MHWKLRGSPIIVLVGFMGCGKSTIGRMLAERLGWSFVDLDEEIERRAGVPISEIFERDGEPHFRQIEHETLLEQIRLARHGRARIVALGGGAFAEARNRDQLDLYGVSIWLDCPVEILWERVVHLTHRPLARDRNRFEQLFRERLPYYRRADFTVSAAGDDPAPALESILQLPLLT